MAIEIVVFDAVGTIMHPASNVAHAYWQVGARFGSRRSRDEIERRFWKVFEQANARRGPRLTTSQQAERAFWYEVVSSIFHDVDSDARQSILNELWNYFAKPNTWRLYSDVLSSFSLLDQLDIQIAVASNFDERLHGICDNLFTSDLTVQVFESASIGFRKPARQFFDHIRSSLKCPPGRLLMVGDNLTIDVRAAMDSGWHAVHVDRLGRSIERHPAMEPGDSITTVNSLAAIRQVLAAIA